MGRASEGREREKRGKGNDVKKEIRLPNSPKEFQEEYTL